MTPTHNRRTTLVAACGGGGSSSPTPATAAPLPPDSPPRLSGGSPATLSITSAALPLVIRAVSVADTLDTAWTEVAREMSAARLWGGMCDRQAVEAGQGIGRLVGSFRLLLLLPPVT